MPRRARKSNSIRHVALSIEQDASFGRDVVRGVVDYARTNPYWRIDLCDATPYFPIKRLTAWRGDGLIVYVNDDADAESIRAAGRPVVNVASARFTPPMPTVCLDNETLGRVAAEHLLQKGLEHFAFVGPAGFTHSILRQKGFSNALATRQFTCDTFEFATDRKGGQRRFAKPAMTSSTYTRWLSSLSLPVGVFAVNDRVGYGLLEACREMELRVPGEVAVIACDNDDLLCTLPYVSMTSIDPNARLLGFRAAEHLNALMEGEPFPAQPNTIVPYRVEARDSTNLEAVQDPHVEDAVRFIRNQADANINVSDVLRFSRVCRRTLERRFKEIVGRSVLEEIHRVHIERAKQLLTDTDLPAIEVASRSGYSSLRRFEIHFRRATGLSAIAYRISQRNPNTH